jgi:hypothetical protein
VENYDEVEADLLGPACRQQYALPGEDLPSMPSKIEWQTRWAA